MFLHKAVEYNTGHRGCCLAGCRWFGQSTDLLHRFLSRGMPMRDGDSGRLVAGATEEEVYSALGLSCMPPEIRENSGEFDAAREGKVPELVRLEQVKGDLHLHTDWSDGSDSIYTKYINTFTDPFSHYLYGSAANSRTFSNKYPVVINTKNYVVFNFKRFINFSIIVFLK